jgi:hypothetical protein
MLSRLCPYKVKRRKCSLGERARRSAEIIETALIILDVHHFVSSILGLASHAARFHVSFKKKLTRSVLHIAKAVHTLNFGGLWKSFKRIMEACVLKRLFVEE